MMQCGGGQGKAKAQEGEAAEKWAVMERMPTIASDFHVLVPQPARAYPFELDIFQKEAIYHMECGDSVFVVRGDVCDRGMCKIIAVCVRVGVG
eukprot:8472734-Pyramimonas_sp.AAC.2